MRILIVSWAWPPIGRVGSLRPLGMAREWTALGHDVHVLTGPGDRGGEYTPDLLPRAAESGATVHRAVAPGIAKPDALRPAHEQTTTDRLAAPKLSRLKQIAAQWKTFPDQQRSWIGPATETARRLHAERAFDIVWSTSPPESAHYVARALAAVEVPWLADFRDQWADYLLARWDPLSRRVIDRIARRVLAPARTVTAATAGVAASLARSSRAPVVCVRSGFDPVVPAGDPVRARRLGYFGRIDPQFQHPQRLWQPLRLLRERGHPWSAVFHVAPGGGGGAVPVAPSDLGALIDVRPPLPHPEALREMQRMAALLVLAWETRGGETTLAGKLYEYVGSGRPVCVVAPPHFEARRLVEDTGTGIGGWAAEEIASALERLESFAVDPHGRASLTRERAARELVALFDSTRAAATAGPGL